jgi:predicted ATPase
MEITIKNVGPIKDIKIDISKELIVLTGPNNSGKTYAAYIIYGLLKTKYGIDNAPNLRDKVTKLITERSVQIDFFQVFKEMVNELSQEIADLTSKELPSIFAVDKSQFKNSEVNIEFINLDQKEKDYFSRSIQRKAIFRNTRNGFTFSISVEKKANTTEATSLVTREGVESDFNVTNEIQSGMPDIMSDFFLTILFDFIFPQAYFFPAERIALSIFSKELSIQRNNLVDKLLEYKESDNDPNPLDLLKRRLTRYSLPIRDSLEVIEDLANFKKSTTKFADLASEIEKEILSGSIQITKEGEIQFKPNKSKSTRLPLHATATAVKSLAQLVIYLRHLAKPHDFLLFDEPELNLHPNNQIIIARLMVKLVNRGFKVLLSTHSDYIIREINNMIMANEQPEIARSIGYTEDIKIAKERVGAYYFSNRKPSARALKIDKEGFDVPSIDDTISLLNQNTERFLFGE